MCHPLQITGRHLLLLLLLPQQLQQLCSQCHHQVLHR
jgi:hypothetical protein